MVTIAPVIGITVIALPVHAVGAVIIPAETSFRDFDVGFICSHLAVLTFFNLFLSLRKQYGSLRPPCLHDRL